MIEIINYTSEHQQAWDNVVSNSRNGTFLLTRAYMDYHKDRFIDHSMLALKNNDIIAVLPANISGETLYTHQGLTYGGWIVSSKISLADIPEVMLLLCNKLQSIPVSSVIYKPVPACFHEFPYHDDLFVLSLFNANMIRVDTSYVIDYSYPYNIQTRRLRSVKKAQKAGVQIRYNCSLEKFWNGVLIPHLAEKYKTKPVHTLTEINLLQGLFPENIIQCNAFLADEIVAGATIYINKQCAHTQYIASSDTGRDSGAIDLLFHHMITEIFNSKKYFSFGTSNNSGNDLNFGVAEWKAGWGGYTLPHFYFRFNTAETEKLKKLVNH